MQKLNRPGVIAIDRGLRLRAYDGNYQQAVPWYQDEVVYYNSEGITKATDVPDADYVKGMYEFLDRHGELYFIEVLEAGRWIPVGDVTVKAENPPIVIGMAQYRGIGIGKRVMQAVIKRAKEKGIHKIYGSTVYEHNIASQKLHESLGFTCVEVRGNEKIYELAL